MGKSHSRVNSVNGGEGAGLNNSIFIFSERINIGALAKLDQSTRFNDVLRTVCAHKDDIQIN